MEASSLMPFVTNRPLPDMINVQAATKAGRAMTEKGADRLVQATKVRTPIDTSYSMGAPSQRPKGTARESIVRGAIRRHTSSLGRGWQAAVYTEDPIFPYIEWNTRPHRIEPTAEHKARAAAEGRTAMLRFPQNGIIRYALSVWHPGTQGQHPFSIAAAYVQAEVGESFFAAELEQFAHDLTASRVSEAVSSREDAAQAIMSQAVAAWIRANTVKLSQGDRSSGSEPIGGV